MTNWNELYFRLVSSDFRDDRWSSQNFGRQRLKDVQTALKYLEKHDIAKYNIQSIATAKFGAMASTMMGGKKGSIKADYFLPFDVKKIQKEESVTGESMAVLQRLMKQRRMDGRVIALLADELKTFSSRNQDQ
jgi:hypothetical protein